MVVENFWLKHKVAICLAALGTLFHVLYVVYVLGVIWIRGGEAYSITALFAIVDFPLYVLVFVAPALGHLLGTSSTLIFLYFSILGTLMYMLVGWTLGWMCDYLRRLFHYFTDSSI